MNCISQSPLLIAERGRFLYIENPRLDRGFSYLIGMSLQRIEKTLL